MSLEIVNYSMAVFRVYNVIFFTVDENCWYITFYYVLIQIYLKWIELFRFTANMLLNCFECHFYDNLWDFSPFLC